MMINNEDCDKMILAVLQGDDYHEAIADLNKKGIYATILHSSGGFLKKKSITIMIGLNHEKLDDALKILKSYGERTETVYEPVGMGNGALRYAAPVVPLPVRCGGVVLFVLDVAQSEKY